MKTRWFIMILAGAALIASMAVAADNKGAEQISIDSGAKANVPFPHRAHQDRLKDCNICHALFPQEPGALGQLKSIGQLQQKQVMTQLCIKCHKTEEKAGNKSGPTTCSKCHIK
jgi:cytochrome c-type protein NrfB